MADFSLSDLFNSGMVGNSLGMPDVQLNDQQKQGMTNSGLLALAGALMEAGGPNATQVTPGMAIGRGIKAMGQATTDAQNQYMKNMALAAQTQNMKADAASKNVGLAMNLDKYNQLRQLNGQAPMNLNDYTSMQAQGGGAGWGQGMVPPGGPQPNMPLPPGGMRATGASGAPQPPQAGGPATTAYDPADTSPGAIQRVYMGQMPGSPQQHLVIGNMLANAGDAAGAEMHRKIAYQGNDGFRPNPTDWNAPAQPINGANPAYVGQKSAAESLGKNFGEAYYAYPKSAGENAGRFYGPTVVGPDNALTGGGQPPMPSLPNWMTAGAGGQGPSAGPVPAPVGPAMPPQAGPSLPPQGPQPMPSAAAVPPPVPARNAPAPSVLGGANPRANIPVPGPITNPSLGATKAALDTMGKADADEVAKTRADAQAGNESLGNIQQVHNLLDSTRQGWGTDKQLEAAKVLAAMGVKQDDINKQILGINPAASEVLSKNFLQMSTNAAKSLGSREPGSVIQMFGKAYPSNESTHDTTIMQTNALKMDILRKQAEAEAKSGYLTDSINQQGQTGQYRGLNGFNSQFNQSNSPSDYVHAAAAMSGPNAPTMAPTIAGNLAKLSPEQYKSVIGKIPSGSQFIGRDGQVHVRN